MSWPGGSGAGPAYGCTISARCGPAGATGLLGLDLTDRRSGYPAETVVKAADAGWRIAEVDVDYLPRRGRSKVTGTPLGAWRAVRDLSAAIDVRRLMAIARRRVIVLAKQPRPGRVKTRLQTAFTPDAGGRAGRPPR